MLPDNNAHVLPCIDDEPGFDCVKLAARVGITEGAVQRMLTDLKEACYLSRNRLSNRDPSRLCQHALIRRQRSFTDRMVLASPLTRTLTSRGSVERIR